MNNLLFTVFTPTYNRAHVLYRVYESLLVQTHQNFEWVIVDDGSVDNTREQVERWKKEAHFKISYFFQKNQGKHIAFNRGVQEAKGEFFVPLDSDDECVPNALERLYELWRGIPNSEHYSGVCVNCVDQNGKLVGKLFPKNKMDSNSCEMLYRHHIKGEKWGFHKVSVLKKYPFPELEDLNFIPECIVWHAISKEYKVRFVNESLRIYYIEENSKDSLTKNKDNLSAIRARFEYYMWVLNNDIFWFKYNPIIFLKYAFQYARYAKKLQIKYINQLEVRLSNALVILMWLPVTMLSVFDKATK